MSGDETDPGSTKRERRVKAEKDHPAAYRIIDSEWKSDEFTAFLRDLDARYRDDWADPNGRPGIIRANKDFLHSRGLSRRARRTRGNPPRTRLDMSHNSGKLKNTPAPEGLPQNCYRPSWLAKMQTWRREMLGIQNTDYDFSIPDDDGPTVQLSGAVDFDDEMDSDNDVSPGDDMGLEEQDAEADYMAEDEDEDGGEDEDDI